MNVKKYTDGERRGLGKEREWKDSERKGEGEEEGEREREREEERVK